MGPESQPLTVTTKVLTESLREEGLAHGIPIIVITGGDPVIHAFLGGVGRRGWPERVLAFYP